MALALDSPLITPGYNFMKEFVYEEDVPKMTQEEKAYYEAYVRDCGLMEGHLPTKQVYADSSSVSPTKPNKISATAHKGSKQ